MNPKKLELVERRLKAFREAEHLRYVLSNAIYRYENAWPGEHLALLEKLCFSKSDVGAISETKEAISRLESGYVL